MNDRIRILVVDDHEVVRKGVTLTLRVFEEFEIVGEAINGVEAIKRCAEFMPDVILMDISMPEMDGITATRQIRQTYPQVQVVALTIAKDAESIRLMLKAGAIGYLLKTVSMDDVTNAIRQAKHGRLTLSPEVAEILLTPPAIPLGAANYHLTERELEVLSYMVQGLNNLEIAEQLTIAYSTIKFHVSSIFAKLNVNNRVEAVRIALEADLFKDYLHA